MTALALALSLLVAGKPPPLFPAPWIDGVSAQEPATQTQRIGRDTYVIRQSLRTSFEAPFLYLLIGHDRALLLDDGAGGASMRPAVDAALSQWLAEHHRLSIPLVVAHTHGHSDHVAGDPEFRVRPGTTVVGAKRAEVAEFFDLLDWPQRTSTYELGRRKLTVIPAPGHHSSHIMIYDPQERLLFSGDALYPGRLYVPINTFGDAARSLDRVVATLAHRPIRAVLGAHIEMTAVRGLDFPDRATRHPDEHRLELHRQDVIELHSALDRLQAAPKRELHDDFIIFPLPPRPARPDEQVPPG